MFNCLKYLPLSSELHNNMCILCIVYRWHIVQLQIGYESEHVEFIGFIVNNFLKY